MLLTYFHEWCNDCENCCVSVIGFPYLQPNENVNRPRVQPFVYIFAVIACCLCVDLSICLDTTLVVFANVSKCLQCDTKIIFFRVRFQSPPPHPKTCPHPLCHFISLRFSLSDCDGHMIHCDASELVAVGMDFIIQGDKYSRSSNCVELIQRSWVSSGHATYWCR